jgi:DNA-binding HxlR family transcriptional regulator
MHNKMSMAIALVILVEICWAYLTGNGVSASLGKLLSFGIVALGTIVTLNGKKDSLNIFESFDRSLNEPIRFLVLEKLWIHGTSSFTHLRDSIRAEIPSLTNGNLSSHLGYLERLGYVKAQRFIHRKKAKSNYTITEKGKRAFEFFLISLHNRLHQSIKALKIEQSHSDSHNSYQIC